MTSKAQTEASAESPNSPMTASSAEPADVVGIEEGAFDGNRPDIAGSMPAEAESQPLARMPDSIGVLLVEDDQDYRETLTRELSEQGFAVQSFADGASLLRSLDPAVHADVIILDWILPKMTGVDLLTRLRRKGVGLPVVFFTDHDLKAHESLAFDRGAFDFAFKSRGVEILAKRLRRVAKAGRAEALFSLGTPLALGGLVLRPDDRRACWKGVDLDLTLGEFKIVHLLASNAGRYVSNRMIYDRLHYRALGPGTGSPRYRTNVRSAIKRIRNKFRACDSEFREIRNYTAFGYCWGNPDGSD